MNRVGVETVEVTKLWNVSAGSRQRVSTVRSVLVECLSLTLRHSLFQCRVH